jgi:peroxiredoxin Q/BCP
MLEPGDQAPDFDLPDQSDGRVKLSDHRGQKVFVYFYPKASTPGCTTQACAVNDALPDLGGTAVFGISPDKPSALHRFAEKYTLGFPLLSDIDHSVADAYGVWAEKYTLGFPLLADVDHSVAEAYGVWAEKSMYGRKYMGIVRSAFLIDEDGKIEQAWYKISPKDTPLELKKALGV